MLDSTDIRKNNTNRIRTELWKGGEHTKLSMAADTGLSVATCNTLLNELAESGEVTGEKRQINGVGRSSMIYKINENFECILCVRFDLLSDNMRSLNIDVISMLGNVIRSTATSYPAISADMIGKHIAGHISDFSNISLILIGTNGIIDNGVIRMSDIPEMDNVDLETELKKYTGSIPFYLAYDCQYRAYGAYKVNHYENITLTIMHCIKHVIPGTATVVNGRIIKGKNGFAGMTGYMPSELDKQKINEQIAAGNSDIIVNSIVSVITVLNPDEFVFAGNVINEDHLDMIRTKCGTFLPEDFLPHFSVAEDSGMHYYLEGMYHMAKDIKTDNIPF